MAEAVYSSEAEYTAAFDVLDFDKDGFLSLEHQEKGPTHSAAYAAQFEALDVDKDRKLSRKEYHAGFARMDMDRNGVLDTSELPHTRDLPVRTPSVSLEGDDAVRRLANASPTAVSEGRVPSAHAEAAPAAPRAGAEGARLGAHADGGEGGGGAVEEAGGSERPLLYTSPAPAMPAKLGEDPLYVALPALRMPPDAWDGGDVPLAAEHIEADAAFESLERWLGRHDALAAAPAGSTVRLHTQRKASCTSSLRAHTPEA
jgi:Ca2+-binding EF-hand superfamily protein